MGQPAHPGCPWTHRGRDSRTLPPVAKVAHPAPTLEWDTPLYQQALTQLEHELFELNEIGIRLSAERNRDALLDTILTRAREITRSDAGSLYLVDEGADGTRSLVFMLAQNDSVKIPFRESHLPLTSESVAGHVALSGEILNLADAYHPPAGVPFHINRSFDDQARYRTKSMLVVPMRTPQGETIGVLQLINCKPDFARPSPVNRGIPERSRAVPRDRDA